MAARRKKADEPPSDRFREKLIDIAARITEEDLKKLKYGCKDIIPDGKREKITSAEALFEELQKRKKLSLNNRTFVVQLFRLIGFLTLADELENWEDLDRKLTEVFT